VHHLLTHEIDLSAFEARFRNDDTGAPVDPAVGWAPERVSP
jgi:hypothetical protein